MSSVGFYNINNPPNFKVRDPIARLTNEVATINNTLDGIHPGGATYFFNGVELQTWRINELVNVLPSYTGTLLMTHFGPAEQQTKTITVPTKDFTYVVFGTNPTKDLLGPNCTEATWEVHLYNQTTSTQLSVGMLPLFGNLTDSDYNVSYMWDYFYPVRIAPQTSDLVTETTIKNLVSATNNRVQSSQLWVILAFYNENTVDENITLYFGGPRELNTRSRLETNWLSVQQPPMMSWVYGYYASGASEFNPNYTNPLQGAFSVDDVGGSIPMFDLYGKYLDLSLRPWNNANIWGLYWNGDISYVQINDVYDPSNSFQGFIDSWDLNPSTPNPYTVYKGFNYIYKTNYGESPAINRLYIYSLTGGNGSSLVEDIYSYYSSDTNDDYWTVENWSTNNPDTVIYTSIYTDNFTGPMTALQIQTYFQTFVDYVIYNGSSTVPSVSQMQTNFNNNFPILKAVCPPLATEFQFLTYENCTIFGGLGTNFRPNIAFGRGYFPATGYFNGINNPGFGYTVGEVVTVSGTDLGGASPANDAIITISQVDGLGAVLAYSVTGTPKYLQNQSNIFDGGFNQYDNGNFISSFFVSNLSYGDGSVQNGLFGPGSSTVIDYNDSIFVCFNRDTYNNPVFQISGDLGFNGYGNYEVGNINQSMYLYINEFNNYGANGSLTPGNIYNIQLNNAMSNFSKTNTENNLSLSKKVAFRTENKTGPSRPAPKPLSEKQLRKQAYWNAKSQPKVEPRSKVAKRSLRRQNPNVVQRLEDQLVTLSVTQAKQESLSKVDPATFLQTIKSKFASAIKK